MFRNRIGMSYLGAGNLWHRLREEGLVPMFNIHRFLLDAADRETGYARGPTGIAIAIKSNCTLLNGAQIFRHRKEENLFRINHSMGAAAVVGCFFFSLSFFLYFFSFSFPFRLVNGEDTISFCALLLLVFLLLVKSNAKTTTK